MASTDTMLLVPPCALTPGDAPAPETPRPVPDTTPTFALTPSTMKELAYERWPLTLNCPGLVEDAGVSTTPGVIAISDWKLRPLSGRFSTNVRSTTVPTTADCVLISGAPAATVTDSFTDPIASSK